MGVDHLITIAIPYYRGLPFLRRAIESVIQQTNPAWRLLVVGDCGSETSPAETIAQFNDSRIRYVQNDRNLGMAGNWNRCLELAETELVNLLHNDDELLPNYVERMLAANKRFPEATAFFCRAKVIDGTGRDCFSFVDFVKRFIQPSGMDVLRLTGRSAIKALMHGNFIMCPTMCYRKSLLAGERFRSHWKQVLDLDLFVRILFSGGMLIGLPCLAYAYRRHDDNATKGNTQSLLRFKEESRLHDEVAAICRQRGWRHAETVARHKRIIQAHLLYTCARELCRFRLHSATSAWSLLNRLFKHSRLPIRSSRNCSLL